jgi:hypothetical protein
MVTGRAHVFAIGITCTVVALLAILAGDCATVSTADFPATGCPTAASPDERARATVAQTTDAERFSRFLAARQHFRSSPHRAIQGALVIVRSDFMRQTTEARQPNDPVERRR